MTTIYRERNERDPERLCPAVDSSGFGPGAGSFDPDGCPPDRGDRVKLHLALWLSLASAAREWQFRLRTKRLGLEYSKLSQAKIRFEPHKLIRPYNPILAWRRLLLVAFALSIVSSNSLWAQGETTSAIVGSVSDPSGDAIAGATVTITSTDNGLKRSVKTDEAGRFSFPQLKPGPYSVKVERQQFESQANDSVLAGLGQKQTVDFTLKIATANQEVTVTEEAPLINPQNPNTSTTLNARMIESLPNPGGDMTYPIQFAPGALMNTAGSGNDFVGGTNGYGNVQFNGLPSLSNGYIVDGLETNDPLTNLNSGLSTNLVLGLNSIAEMTVNTLSYAVDQGRYGASQVNYVTKSGTNQFHGNLYELWNGSAFNAANFFTNSTPGSHKPRSTVNHFGGSLGGPIKSNKLFFFFDAEWVRIALPIVSATTVPTPAFQNYVLQQLPRGGTDSVTGSTYQPSPQSVPLYQKMFALYKSTAGSSSLCSGVPVQQQRQPGNRQPTEWGWLCKSAERFTVELRFRAGPDCPRGL